MKTLPLLCALLLVLGCGDDKKNPVAPDPDLVGTWTFTGSDLPDVVADNLENYLEDLGLSSSDAESAADEFEAEMEKEFTETRSVIRFDADGTYEDDDGIAGTWSVDGNEVSLMTGDGPDRARYFVSGNDLTMIFDYDTMLKAAREGGEFWSEEDQALFDVVFQPGDTVRLFYRRN